MVFEELGGWLTVLIVFAIGVRLAKNRKFTRVLLIAGIVWVVLAVLAVLSWIYLASVMLGGIQFAPEAFLGFVISLPAIWIYIFIAGAFVSPYIYELRERQNQKPSELKKEVKK